MEKLWGHLNQENVRDKDGEAHDHDEKNAVDTKRSIARTQHWRAMWSIGSTTGQNAR